MAALPPATGPDGEASGLRAGESLVKHRLSDRMSLAWNPTNGNIVLTGDLLHVQGVSQDVSLGWRYNSFNDARPTLTQGTRESAVRVTTNNEIIYTAEDGGEYTFAPDGNGGYKMAPGLDATIRYYHGDVIDIDFDKKGYQNHYVRSGDLFVLRSTDDFYGGIANRVSYYDTDGRLTSTVDTKWNEMTYTYADTRNPEQPSRVTDETLNRHIDIEYGGGEGRMSSITDAAGTRIEFGYNADGKISTITDGRGNVTALEYDLQKRASKITYGVGTAAESVWTPSYNPHASPVSVLTDPNGNQAVYNINGEGLVTSVVDPNGNTVSSTFDNHNNLTSTTDGLGNLTTMTWNPNNTLAKITSPAGADGGQGKEVSFTYDGRRDPSASTDSEGNTTTYTYDGNSTHMNSLTTPDGRGVTLKWFYEGDEAGTMCGAQRGQLCKTVDAKGNVTQYGYDANRNVDTINRPGPLGTITMTSDPAGRVLTSTDGKGQTAHYSYDGNDRLTQIRYGATCVPATCVTYTYDANGNLTQRIDAAGTTTYTYDAQNRPTTKTIGGITTRPTYDGASNILSFSDPTGTVEYSYDAGNRLVSLAEPGGSCPATPAFPNSTGCTGFEYDKNNQRTATHYPNGVTNTTVYDNAGRVESITAKRSGGAILTKRDYTYTVGDNGKDGSLVKTKTTETGEVTTYGYDKSLRLLSATTGNITESWHYDVNNNRTVDRKTGQPNQYAAYNAADQLCWASGSRSGTCNDAPAGAPKYSYDANGNTTAAGDKTRTYNVFDQLATATKGSETFNLSYAGSSNTERASSGATNFLNGLLGITREVTNGETTSFIRDPDGKLISMRNSDGRFYYTTDKLGSVLTLTNSGQNKAASYTYDAWGKTTSTGPQATANPWQYAGGYYEESTGRIKFGARYYNQWRGRFNQVDPSSQEQNRYLYAKACPTTYTDPTGLATDEEISDFMATAICAVGFYGYRSSPLELEVSADS